MRLENIMESAPGKKGKTTAKDARAFVANESNAEYIDQLKRIAKKMGGVTSVIEVLKAIGTHSNMNESEMMSEDSIKQAMAESGKMKITQLMSYMKARYQGKYDTKLAREIAREMVAEM